MEREPRTRNRFPRLHVMSMGKPPLSSRSDPTVAASRAGNGEASRPGRYRSFCGTMPSSAAIVAALHDPGDSVSIL